MMNCGSDWCDIMRVLLLLLLLLLLMMLSCGVRDGGEYREHIQVSHSGAGELIIISSVWVTADTHRTSQTAAEAKSTSIVVIRMCSAWDHQHWHWCWPHTTTSWTSRFTTQQWRHQVSECHIFTIVCCVFECLWLSLPPIWGPKPPVKLVLKITAKLLQIAECLL